MIYINLASYININSVTDISIILQFGGHLANMQIRQ